MINPIEITYNEPQMNAGAPQDTRLENIIGTLPHVSAAPTWTPRSFSDNFAMYRNGATYRLYVYNKVTNSWRYVALT